MKKLFIFLFVYFLSIGHAWAQTFTGPGGSVPGNSTAETCFSQVIAGVGTINSSYGLASVCINLTHTNDDDNEIFLVAPDGTKVPLSVNNGGAGDNYTNTCFSHTATASVKFGTAPFNGSYIPDGYLGMVNNGQNANGVWKLCVWDRRNPASGSGTLTNWSITFSNSPAPQPPAKPACSTTLVTGTSCSGAPMICSFSGVCGKTGGTDQQWPALASAACFGIENNSFVKFVASSSTVVFSVWVSSATTSLVSGIQAIFFSGTCSGTITSYGCYAHMRPNTLTQLTATGLTAGNTYYLMFDGYGGDVADFTIEAESGVNILDIDPGSASICEGESVDLTASGGNGIYAWTPATGLSATSGATVTATPGTGNNTYRVTSAGVGNCPIFKDVTVTVNAKPVITAQPATATQSVCQNGTVTALSLTANAGSGTIKSYQWYSNTTASTVGGTLLTGATAAGYTPSSAALGTLYYYCIITNSNDCTVTSNVSGAITITSPPAAPTVEVADECGKSTLTAKNYTGTLTWSDGGTGNPRTITTVSGPYTVTQTINGCTSEASNAVSANPSSISAPTLEVSDECGKSTLTAKNYTGALTWSDGGTGNPRTITTASGPYTVTQTANSCTSEASNAVSANPSSISAPTLEVSDECGKSTLTAKNYTGTLTWSDGGTGNPRTITTVSGPYTVTQTANGCTSEASNAVSANPSSISAPTLEVSDECGKSTLTAKNYTGALTWSDGGTGNPRTITTVSGPYTVTQTANGCTSEASNAVSANPSSISAPTLEVSDECGKSTLTAKNYTGALTWSDGGTGNPRTITTVSGPYTVTQTASGCTSEASNAVSANPSSISSPTLEVADECGKSTLTAKNYTGTLTWSDGGTGNPRTITTVSGPYTVTQTMNGCTSEASNTVSANPSSISAPTLEVSDECGKSTLTAKNYTGTLTWSDAGTGNPRTITTASGPYTVTQSASGCISEASNAVSAAPSAIPQPPVLVVVNNCGNAVITATGYTGTLTWSDGGTGNPRTFTSAGGHYTVTQTIGACTSLLSNAVSTDPLPLPPAPVLTVSNSCSEATITATGYAGTLNWSDGGTGNPRIITTPGGPFTATQTIGTCTSRLSNGVMADFTGGGAANLLGNNTYLCPGETLLLDPGEYAAYVWQDNSVSRTYTVTRAGTYSVTVTDNQGCAFNDEIIVKGLVNCNEVYFPTAFSPNKDGKNDGFGVLGNLPGISAYSLSVYDRYGNVIFNTTDPYKKWDGTINGVQSNLNNYVWMAAYIYKGTEKRLQKGNIVLIR